MTPSILRLGSLLATLGAALGASANVINFDGQTGIVGNAYLSSDGVSFVNGESLAVGSSAPSPSNVLIDTGSSTITMNAMAASLVTSVSVLYASNGLGSGQAGSIVPSLSVYSGANGTGALLGSFALADTPNAFTNYIQATVSFAGNARSVVLTAVPNHVRYDNLTFTPAPVPEPASWMALGFGAVALLRRKRLV